MGELIGRRVELRPVLLVLGNFEDNPDLEGTDFTDDGTSAVIEHLAESCHEGKLLVTCRHPLPGLQGLLHHLSIGPLSSSETRRLFLRLEGLSTLAGEDAALVHQLVGGHPRVLEFLDALRRRGASTSQVRRKFHDLADVHEIDLDQTRELGENVALAVQLGARDICLDGLLSALTDAEREVLLQTAVSALPARSTSRPPRTSTATTGTARPSSVPLWPNSWPNTSTYADSRSPLILSDHFRSVE